MASSINVVRKKFHETHELISVAYHEAGHAVYGLLRHVNVHSIFLTKDNKTKRIHGFTEYEPCKLDEIQDPILFNDRLHAEIEFFYAGLSAEKRHFKLVSGSDNFPMFLREGCSDDFSQAANLFAKYNLIEPGIKRFKYKRKLIKAINLEIQNHWEAITAIAHALFKKKKLNFLEINQILIKKCNKDFWKTIFKNQELINKTLDENKIKSIMSL